MAVKLESFLVLEESLSKRLNAAIDRAINPVLAKIKAAVRDGDFKLADDLVYELDLMPAVESQKKYIDLIGLSSALYGSSRLVDVKDSSFNRKSTPEMVKEGRQTLIEMIGVEGTTQIRKAAQREIDAEERRRMDGAFKAENVPFVTGFPKIVKRAGKQMVDIGSSLHTSRLASWGFAMEAAVQDVQYYEISEQLDGRTCPVCRIMDGKVFPTNSALDKLEGQLSVTDPNQLKSIAEWPRQDPASVASLSQMTTAQLIARGWDTPPFHPMCRGVLVRTSKALSQDDFERDQETREDAAFVQGLLLTTVLTPGEAAVVGAVASELDALDQ